MIHQRLSFSSEVHDNSMCHAHIISANAVVGYLSCCTSLYIFSAPLESKREGCVLTFVIFEKWNIKCESDDLMQICELINWCNLCWFTNYLQTYDQIRMILWKIQKYVYCHINNDIFKSIDADTISFTPYFIFFQITSHVHNILVSFFLLLAQNFVFIRKCCVCLLHFHSRF